MGACLSAGAPPSLVDNADGDEAAFHQHYYEDEILGQGEFGIVKMVHPIVKNQSGNIGNVNTNARPPLACKILRKGVVFKDNTLYTPLKPEVLRGEVEILRTLAGKRYCLKLVSVYESPRTIFVITEYCGGGEMMEYVSKLQDYDLTTEDVSRIAFQLLSAVDHCAQHNIIHRDIKPENCMFQDPTPGAELRLIDYGSSVMDKVSNSNDETVHTTFAGSAFYISPEMFQHTYTSKTDVWSAGVTLYVLVAGYPADCLQKAFNYMQKGSDRDLRKLPNQPDNMPDSYYELLEGLLVYRHRRRPSAAAMLENAFVRFHKEDATASTSAASDELSLGEIAAAAASAGSPSNTRRRAGSVSLKGSVGRHSVFLDFKRFERSLTTLLATMLTKHELDGLLLIIKQKLDDKIAQDKRDESMAAFETVKHANKEAKVDTNDNDDTIRNNQESENHHDELTHRQKLSVVKVHEIKNILINEMKCDNVVQMMQKIPNEQVYTNFAYHVALLQDFGAGGVDFGNSSVHSTGRRRIPSSKVRKAVARRSGSFSSSVRGNAQNVMNDSNHSIRSSGSVRARKIFGGSLKNANKFGGSGNNNHTFSGGTKFDQTKDFKA